MPNQDRSKVRDRLAQARNNIRWVWNRTPAIQKKEIRYLARRGLAPKVAAELDGKVADFQKWTTGGGAQPKIRVKADTVLTDTPGAAPTFVGVGLDEHVATRLQTDKAKWVGISATQAEAISGARSRTADLVWATGDPNEPIAGHTPGIKRQLVSGTTGAITAQHGTRDTAREHAVDQTLNDPASPDRPGDIAMMGTLATIKYMSSPDTELDAAKADVAKLTSARYSALTGTKDLRVGANFDEMTAHVQEERERKKWEAAAVMKGDPRLSPLVPPTMDSYLGTHGNDPLAAMDKFRYDAHYAWFKPFVNTSVASDTEDLRAASLHTLAVASKTGARRRALSDARLPPVSIPINARGRI